MEEINEAQNNSALNDEEKEQRETRVRKEALVKIFDLTLLEDEDLKKQKTLQDQKEFRRSKGHHDRTTVPPAHSTPL